MRGVRAHAARVARARHRQADEPLNRRRILVRGIEQRLVRLELPLTSDEREREELTVGHECSLHHRPERALLVHLALKRPIGHRQERAASNTPEPLAASPEPRRTKFRRVDIGVELVVVQEANAQSIALLLSLLARTGRRAHGAPAAPTLWSRSSTSTASSATAVSTTAPAPASAAPASSLCSTPSSTPGTRARARAIGTRAPLAPALLLLARGRRRHDALPPSVIEEHLQRQTEVEPIWWERARLERWRARAQQATRLPLDQRLAIAILERIVLNLHKLVTNVSLLLRIRPSLRPSLRTLLGTSLGTLLSTALRAPVRAIHPFLVAAGLLRVALAAATFPAAGHRHHRRLVPRTYIPLVERPNLDLVTNSEMRCARLGGHGRERRRRHRLRPAPVAAKAPDAVLLAEQC
eukprot:5558258-Pleurochrysis_carterae.AAC.2